MSEPRWTPGPWTVVLRGERGTFHIPEAAEHEKQFAWSYEHQDGYNVSSANARLIAAAPDLLASCRSLIEALELIGRDHAVWWPHDGDLVVRARSAIAKATGGES